MPCLPLNRCSHNRIYSMNNSLRLLFHYSVLRSPCAIGSPSPTVGCNGPANVIETGVIVSLDALSFPVELIILMQIGCRACCRFTQYSFRWRVFLFWHLNKWVCGVTSAFDYSQQQQQRSKWLSNRPLIPHPVAFSEFLSSLVAVLDSSYWLNLVAILLVSSYSKSGWLVFDIIFILIIKTNMPLS